MRRLTCQRSSALLPESRSQPNQALRASPSPARASPQSRPQLDDVSRGAILGPAAEPVTWYHPGDAQDDAGKPANAPDSYDKTTPEGALWLALCTVPDEGADIAELICLTAMSRSTLYRHLGQHARAGRAIQVSRGRWRATTTEDPR